MDFLKKFFGASSQPIVIVGADTAGEEEKEGKDTAIILHYASIFTFILALLFSWYSTGGLISKYEAKLRMTMETAGRKKTEQANLDALLTLSKQVDTILEQKKILEQAIPLFSAEDQVIRWIDYELAVLAKKFRVELPDHISWSNVSRQDILNPDFENLDVQEYTFPFIGEYQALLELISDFRLSARLFDVRALRSLQLKEGGLVTGDVVFWTYHLPSD